MGLPSDLTGMHPVDIGSLPIAEALFPVGRVLATSLALQEIQRAGEDMRDIITRHCNGQFGNCDIEEVFENLYALGGGDEVGSFFYFDEAREESTALCVWTNAERTETRLMRRDEF